MSVKSSISLTDQQANYARKLVEEGRYASLSAVLQQGLDLLRQRDNAERAELEAFREMMRTRMEGPFVSYETFSDRVDDMLARKRREHGLED